MIVDKLEADNNLFLSIEDRALIVLPGSKAKLKKYSKLGLIKHSKEDLSTIMARYLLVSGYDIFEGVSPKSIVRFNRDFSNDNFFFEGILVQKAANFLDSRDTGTLFMPKSDKLPLIYSSIMQKMLVFPTIREQ